MVSQSIFEDQSVLSFFSDLATQMTLAYAPDVTLIFRPELYTVRMLRMLPGIKIGFSSEPLPTYNASGANRSEETNIRETVYGQLAANAYDFFFHYDRRSEKWFEDRWIKVAGYRQLPIDCSVFNPMTSGKKDIDFLFVGIPIYSWKFLQFSFGLFS